MGILEEIRVEGFLKSCLPDNYGSHRELVVKREKGISGFSPDTGSPQSLSP